jgi:hypothetical protein
MLIFFTHPFLCIYTYMTGKFLLFLLYTISVDLMYINYGLEKNYNYRRIW